MKLTEQQQYDLAALAVDYGRKVGYAKLETAAEAFAVLRDYVESLNPEIDPGTSVTLELAGEKYPARVIEVDTVYEVSLEPPVKVGASTLRTLTANRDALEVKS